MSGAPLEIIERLPEWRGAVCTALTGGLTNQAWRLAKDGRQAVLKVDDGVRRPPLNSRAAEAEVQSAAASAGLAGEVLLLDDPIYLTAYIDGVVWDRDMLRGDRQSASSRAGIASAARAAVDRSPL